LNWDDQNWESGGLFSSGFSIYFKFPWIFRFFGYRLRSGDKQFPTEWRFFGSNNDHGKVITKHVFLDHQENNSELFGKYSEKSFRIENDNFFDGFHFQLYQNTEGGIKFCLNAIEIFGILREMSEEEKQLEKQRRK
jgi:hypothetical protein